MADKNSIACSVKGRVRKKNSRIYNEDTEELSPSKRLPLTVGSSGSKTSPGKSLRSPREGSPRKPQPCSDISPGKRSVALRTHGKPITRSSSRSPRASKRSPTKAVKLKPLSTRVPAIHNGPGGVASEESSETEDYDLNMSTEEYDSEEGAGASVSSVSPTKPITASDIPHIRLGSAATIAERTKTHAAADFSVKQHLPVTTPRARKELVFPDGPSSQGDVAANIGRHSPSDSVHRGAIFHDTTMLPEQSELAAARISFSHSPSNKNREAKSRPKSSPRKRFSPTRLRPLVPKETYEASKKWAAQQIGMKLRNILKLPKAHRWVCYEWFYSNLDECLLCGENDFVTCLKSSFTTLKATNLMAPQWSFIRRLLGKPRRCSPAFFSEERAHLDSKRSRIRCLQQRKSSEIPVLSDLPEEIPLQLVLGTKVTARLRSPRDGLYTGTVAAVDTQSQTYRVIFERPDLGTHSIPDTEVRSKYEPDTIAVSSFIQKPRKPQGFGGPLLTDSMFSAATSIAMLRSRLLQGDDSGNYGGYPIVYLKVITRLSKSLTVKREWINRLRSINTDIEKLRAFGDPVPFETQRRYAYIVLGMEKLNLDLNDYLKTIQEFTKTLAPDTDMLQTVDPQALRRSTEEEARDLLRQHASQIPTSERLKDASSQNLIIKLTGMLLQVQRFNTQAADPTTFDLSALLESIDECKAKLEPENIAVFKNEAGVHLDFIHSSLTQMGKLRLFDSTMPPYADSDFTKILPSNNSDTDDGLE